ncbi:MAG: hypothetical protein RSA10_00825 [Bacilli bacterium]
MKNLKAYRGIAIFCATLAAINVTWVLNCEEVKSTKDNHAIVLNTQNNID